jgi:type I restriction enzyme M protein
LQEVYSVLKVIANLTLQRGNNLDISWLRDESLQSGDGLPEPEAIASQIMLRLQTAMEEMEALTVLLDDEEETETALLE